VHRVTNVNLKKASPYVEGLKGWLDPRRLGLDKAIAMGLLGRAWSGISGPLTLALVAGQLSPGEQGFYYTFASLTGMQVFFELGLSFVLMQKASHEKARLTWTHDGKLAGDPVAVQRLSCLFKGGLVWYGWAAFAFGVVALTLGGVYFSRFGDDGDVSWRGPWTITCVMQALAILAMPLLSILEGCGRVADVAGARLAQAVLGTTIVWSLLLMGGKLWATAAMPTSCLMVGVFFAYRFRGVVLQLKKQFDNEPALHWRQEILPFQWRIGVSWLSGYFMFQFFTPVIFAYWGAREAGQFGMSLNIVNAVASGPLAWISTKAPLFGELIANRHWPRLDATFFRALKQSSVLLILCYLAIAIAAHICAMLGYELADRILAPWLFALLCSTGVVNHFVMSLAYYLRAYGNEPFVRLSVSTGVLNAVMSLVAGRRFGVEGITIGYCALQWCIVLPWAAILYKHNKQKYRSALS
jgi:O-antigen/teichoic acid export membrane protein